MLRFPVLAAMLLCLGAGPLAAAELYRAEVAAADASAAARPRAAQEALAQVLVRLLPRDDQARRASAALGADASSLLASYEYRTGEDGTQTFRARFDAPALHQRLSAAGLPGWGEPRPRVLLWIGYDGGGGVGLVGSDSPLSGVLATAAARYGLPVELPLLDAGEQAQVTPRAVVGLDWEELAAASVAYAPDAYAALLVSAGQEPLRGRVNLSRPDGETSAARLEADTVDALFDAAVRHIAGELAAYYLGEDATLAAASAPPPVHAAGSPVERPLPATPGELGPVPTPRPPLAVPAAVPLGPVGPAQTPALPDTAPAGASFGTPPSPPLVPAPPVLAPAHADGVLVELSGLRSGAEYQRARAQLAGFGGVIALHPLAATGDAATFELRYPAGAVALSRALALDGAFEVIAPADGGSGALRLRLRGG
jgi:hypothetical protein